jgi:hypothetical protein
MQKWCRQTGHSYLLLVEDVEAEFHCSLGGMAGKLFKQAKHAVLRRAFDHDTSSQLTRGNR